MPQAQIRGLLVGINRYTNLPEDKQLHGCVRDTENVRNLLTGKFSAAAQNISILNDERATKAAILTRLARLVRDTRAGDVAVFHFSSHGALITRREPSGALMDHSTEILCLSSIPPTLDDPNSFIGDSDLSAVLNKLVPGALMVTILDACHSGGIAIARDLNARKPTRASRCLVSPLDMVNRDAARVSKYGGAENRHRLLGRSAAAIDSRVFVLTACRADQTSSDSPVGRHYEGAFTHALCEVLGKDRTLSYEKLLAGIQAMLKGENEAQTPEFLPADCSGRRALAPLDSVAVATFAEHLANRKLDGSLTVHNGATKAPPTTDVVVPAIPVTAADPRLQAVLEQLRIAGYVVQPPVKVAPPSTAQGPSRVVLDIPDGYGGWLLEFHDGVIVWHKARKVSVGRALAKSAKRPPAQPAAGRKTLEFHVYPLPAATTDKGLGDGIGRVFHAVLHPIQTITRVVLNKIESHVFNEGLYHYSGGNFHDGATPNPSQTIQPPPDGVLLFIHGIFSSVDGAFGKEPITAMLGGLQQKYAVFGYNHLSTTVGLDEVAMQLDHRLRACIPDGTRIRIVAHSQGGVIARQLACLRPVDRILTCGSPLRGTHMADGLERLVSVLSTINTFIPTEVLGFIANLLKVIDDPDVIPGLLDMKVGGPYLTQLDQTTPKINSSYYAGRSDFRADPSDSVLARLAERVEQWAIFPDANDLVVDTSLMVPPAPIPVQDGVVYDATRHVTHVGYFAQSDTASFIRRVLL